MTDIKPELLTDKDVARRLGLSWQQVQQRCKTGQWPHIKLGRFYRFDEAAYEQIKALHRVTPQQADEPADTWGRTGRKSA